MLRKLRYYVSLLIVLVMVLLSPLQTLAIVLEDYDSRTFNEFERHQTQWEGDTPTIEEAQQLLDAHYPDNFQWGTNTTLPLATQPMTLETVQATNDTQFDSVSIQPQTGYVLRFEDDLLSIPSQSITDASTLQFERADTYFSLNLDNGADAQFNQPVVVSLTLDETETQYIVRDVEGNIQPSSYNSSEGRLYVALGGAGAFDIQEAEPEPEFCDTVGDDADDPSLFETACENVGGEDVLGAIKNSDTAEDGEQTFDNGVLVYNPNKNAVFFLKNQVYTEYNSVGVFNWLGYPTTHSDEGIITGINGDLENVFPAGTITSFDNGFVGFNDNADEYEAHLPFPVVNEVQLTITKIKLYEQLEDTDDDGIADTLVTYYGAHLNFEGDINGNGTDESNYLHEVVVTIDGQSYRDDDNDGSIIIQGPVADYSEPSGLEAFPLGSSVEFNYRVERTGPDTSLSGFLPCSYPLDKAEHNFYIDENFETGDGQTYTLDCDASIVVEVDNIKPTIELTQVYSEPNEDGLTSDIAIQAYAWDNRQVALVTITYNGTTYEMYPYQDRVDASGTGFYEFILTDVPLYDVFSFTLYVEDGVGLSDFEDHSFYNQPNTFLFGEHACFDPACGDNRASRQSVSNPITTDIGNKVETIPLMSYAGVGNAAIDLTATINGQDTNVGYFGSSVTSQLDAGLAEFDNSLFVGVRVTYPDGHTGDFEKLGECDYQIVSRTVFDTLECNEEGGYTLTTVYRDVYEFDVEGRLVAVADLNDNQVVIEYTDELPIAMVSDTGRRLDFVYNADDLIIEIQGTGGKVVTLEYDGTSLVSMTDPNGGIWQYEYEERPLGDLADNFGSVSDVTWYLLNMVTTPEGRLKNAQEFDEDGRVTFQQVGETETYQFIYDDDLNTTHIVDANGYVTMHTYNGLGQLVTVTDATGAVTTYTYNDRSARTGMTDANGNSWLYTVDESGNRLTSDGPLSFHEEFTYNEFNQVTSYLDAEGRLTELVYDENGNLIEIINADGDVQTIVNNERGQPLEITDFAGRVTQFTYDDATGDLIALTDGEGFVTTYEYDEPGRLIKVTYPNGDAYEYHYDGNDNIIEMTGELGWSTILVYDLDDNLIEEIDAMGGSDTYDYDDSGYLVEICNALDFCVQYDYELMGHVSQITDQLGRVVLLTYDEVYRLISTTAPLSTVFTTTYDPVGNPILLTDPEGRVTKTVYDGLNRPVEMIDNYIDGVPASADTNINTIYTYDLVSNITAITDAEGNTTQFRFNALNQMTATLDALGRQWVYDYLPTGDMTAVLNPRGALTRFSYDNNGRLIEITDAESNVTTFVYDGNGNQVSLIDARGVVTQFGYDELDRMVVRTDNYLPAMSPDSETNVTASFEYNLRDDLVSVIDGRGNTAYFVYDAISRLTHSVDRAGANTFFFYDAVGNLQGLVDDNGHPTGFSYDELDRLQGVINPEGHIREFTYDKVGNVLTLMNERGFTETRTYDGLYRLIEMQDFADGIWQFEYDRVGNLVADVDANTHRTTYAYNAVYELTSTVDPKGILRQYEYDAVSNLTRYIDGETNATAFAYDLLDRLIGVNDALNRQTGFTYDPVGNLVAETAPDGVLTRYDFDPLNRLSAVVENYLDGVAGNHETNVTTTYNYDEDNNMVSFVNPLGNVTNFEYDPEGRVVREVDALDNIWQYAYDGVGNLIERRDANNDRTEYAYYPDNMLQAKRYQDRTGTAYFYDETNNLTRIEEVGINLGDTSMMYDALNRQTVVTDALGRTIGIGYDPVSNRTSLTYPDGHTVTYAFDPNDWLESATILGQGTTTYQRNNEGFITEMANPNNTVTTISYDAVYQMLNIRTMQMDNNPSLISATTYTYDVAGMRTSVTSEYGWRQPGSVTSTYDYDPLRRLVGAVDSQNITAEYRYDAAGNRLMWKTSDDPIAPRPEQGNDAFEEWFTYNEINQLVKAERTYFRPNTPPVTQEPEPPVIVQPPRGNAYGHNNPNNPNNPTNTDSVITIESLEEMAADVQYAPPVQNNTSPATPDPTTPVPVVPATEATDVVEVVTEATEVPTEATTEAPTEVTEVATEAPTETPPAIGDLQTATQAACDGVPQGQCKLLISALDVAIAAVNANDYTGAITALNDYIDAANHIDQLSDETRNQLIAQANALIGHYQTLRRTDDVQFVSAELNAPAQGNGNNRGSDFPASGNPRDYIATFDYDANGSRIESVYRYGNGTLNGSEYEYDYERRLTDVRNFRGVGRGRGNRQVHGISTMGYDALGTLVTETYANNDRSRAFETQYLADGWDIIGEYNMQNGQSTHFYRDNTTQLISSEDLWVGGNGAHHWYAHDGLGSVTGISKHIGQGEHNYRYDEYGAVEHENGNFLEPHNTFTYTGKPYNSEVGLYWFGSRHYDPLTAQWMQQDSYRGNPVIPQSVHRYGYVHGSPTNYVDEYGYSISAIAIGIVATVTIVTFLMSGILNPIYAPGVEDALESRPPENKTVPTTCVRTDVSKLSLSDKGAEFIGKQEGGFVDHIYTDSTGNLTIGYGHLLLPGEKEKYKNGISKEEALRLLKQDMKIAEDIVKKYVKVPLKQYEYDALVDFAYNLGEPQFACVWNSGPDCSSDPTGSALLEKLNAGNYAAIPDVFDLWSGGGPGIPKRRTDEGKLFSKGIYQYQGDEFARAPCLSN